MLFLLLYCLDVLLNIASIYFGFDVLKYITKIALMPLLAMFLFQNIREVRVCKFIFLALFFSWVGDIFLMFPQQSTNAKLFFILGLIAFFMSHLNYSIHFIKEINQKTKSTILFKKPYFIFPFLVYIFLFLRLVFPTLGAMKLPVLIYSLVITLMMVLAFNRKNLVKSSSFLLVFLGALFFVFSDSCIAVNLFYKPFESAGLLIMATYCLAQFLIIKGVMIEKQ